MTGISLAALLMGGHDWRLVRSESVIFLDVIRNMLDYFWGLPNMVYIVLISGDIQRYHKYIRNMPLILPNISCVYPEYFLNICTLRPT